VRARKQRTPHAAMLRARRAACSTVRGRARRTRSPAATRGALTQHTRTLPLPRFAFAQAWRLRSAAASSSSRAASSSASPSATAEEDAAAWATPAARLSVADAAAALAVARSAPADASRRLFASTPVGPGASLSLRLPRTAARISVHTGPHGELSLEATWHDADAQNANDAANPAPAPASPPPRLRAVATTDALTLHDDAEDAEAEEHATSASRAGVRVRVRAWVPDRFTSVHVSSAGGPLSLDALTEGDASLRSGGGDVALGALRGGAFEVRTRGGSVTAAALAGSTVLLNSSGGDVAITRLVGRRVALLSGGGAVTLGVAFTERLRLRTAGGAAVIGALRVGVVAAVGTTPGGSLSLRALDGAPGATCALATGGGAADVALEAPAAAMAQVRLHTTTGQEGDPERGGDVALALPPGWAAPLRCASGVVGGMRVADVALTPPAGADGGSVALGGSRRGAAADDAAAGGGAGGGVCVAAGSGAVALRARTWLEGAMAAAAAARNAPK
jgi:hypothetical protein